MDIKPITVNQMLFNLFIIILGYNYSNLTCFIIFSIYTFYELTYFKANDRYNMSAFNNFLQYYGIGIFLEKINFIPIISGIFIGSILSTAISHKIICVKSSQFYLYLTNLINSVYDKLLLIIDYKSKEYMNYKDMISIFVKKIMKNEDSNLNNNENNNFSETDSDKDLEPAFDHELEPELEPETKM